MNKITLAMPVYNVEKYIERALLSALNQTYENIEFIIVDDRGTDKSMNIVRQIILEHPRGKDVRIIEHERNIGLGAGRNTAIENATGKYIFFMDSDDEITPDCINILYEKMLETPVDFIAASCKVVTMDGQSSQLYSSTIYSDMLIPKTNYGVAKEYFKRRYPLITAYTWNKLYNVDFLKNNNIYCIPHHLAEDIFFTYQVILKAQSCRLLSNITYYYYETDTSVAKEYNNIVSQRAAKTFEEIIIAKINYSHDFSKTNFYPIMIRRIFVEATGFTTIINKSSTLSSEEKKTYILNILNISLEEIKYISPLYIIPILLIRKITNIKLKIFLVKYFNKICLMKVLIKVFSLLR
ncbi:MAG: glycosyltransferase [Dysgonamonadaceae bacterium]|jgi:glycosyltransferase involved in cell wall biosynthesis|nr:glycosyltransferase [Dysgonamonadaceae bacterium]